MILSLYDRSCKWYYHTLNKKPYNYNGTSSDNKSSPRSITAKDNAIDIDSLIRRRLSKLIPNADKFLDTLTDSGGVIAGSFLLQCLYGVEYQGSDIDVYHLSKGEAFNHFTSHPRGQRPGYTRFLSYVHRNYVSAQSSTGYINQLVDQSVYYPPPGMYEGKYDDKLTGRVQHIKRERFLHDTIDQVSEVKYSGIVNMIMIRPCEVKEVEIKADIKTEVKADTKTDVKTGKINISYNSELEYILKIFDISICKVVYQPSTKKLYIYDLPGLISKSGTYATKSLLLTRNKNSTHGYNATSLKIILDKRVAKYQSRGFTLTDLQPLEVKPTDTPTPVYLIGSSDKVEITQNDVTSYMSTK